MDKYLDVSPQVHYLPEYDMKVSTEWYGVKALWYEGAMYQGRKTKVYALLGYPEMKHGQKVPAVVLIHGGGGHPYAEWIRRWNEKGFAAIAMDTTGYFPSDEHKGLVGTEKANEEHKFTRELYGELKEDGYTVGPDNSEMTDCNLPREEQWMYHAVVDTILAHNILRCDSRVDSDKIGISGISWGGVITSIAIGYDSRYAFAIPIYGSGYLDYLPAPKLPQIFGTAQVKNQWCAARGFHNVTFPVLWLCYLKDTSFSFCANSLSYKATKHVSSFLSIKQGMGHSHIKAWSTTEGYRFAEKVLNHELPFIKCVTEPDSFKEVSIEIDVPDDFENISAEIFYVVEQLQYDGKNKLINSWESVKARIRNGIVYASVPKGVSGYYLELKGYVGEECYISTSEWCDDYIAGENL